MKKITSLSLGLVLPLLAVAQSQLPAGVTTTGGLMDMICTLANWAFTFLIILAIFFVLFAAFKYLTAAGEPEKIKKASHTLIYAAVAVVIALLAKGFPLLIGSFVGQSGFQGC